MTDRARTVETTGAGGRRHQRDRKNPTDAWLFWMFFGWLGAHRYYIGDWKLGVCMTVTLGGLGVGSLMDGFLLGRRLRRINSGRL